MPALQVPGRVFAAVYDRSLARMEASGGADLRRELLAEAAGDVLEVGAGTGANLGHVPEAVGRLVLTEPDPHMRARLERRAAAAGRRAEVVDAPADALPFPDGAFDVVVATLVLCTVPDQAAALAELRRVLRPGGRLLVLEHVRAPSAGLARVQRLVRPAWGVLGRGCDPSRDTLGALRAAGFGTDAVRTLRLPAAPAPIRPAIAGVATRPG